MVCYTVSVVVMLQIKACNGGLYGGMRRKENEHFLLNNAIFNNFFIHFEIDELCSEINEVQKFPIVIYVSQQMCTHPNSYTIPLGSVNTGNSIMISAVCYYVQIIEEISVIIFESEVEENRSNSYPFVALKAVQRHIIDVFRVHMVSSLGTCGDGV